MTQLILLPHNGLLGCVAKLPALALINNTDKTIVLEVSDDGTIVTVKQVN